MRNSTATALILAVSAALCVSPRGPALTAPPKTAPAPKYTRDIAPLFKARCLSCHGPTRQDGGLRLDLRARGLEGGDSGAAIIPGSAGRGTLLARVTSADPGHRMPLGGKPLSAPEVILLRKWIEAGADWPADEPQAGNDLGHWSFRPIRPPAVPRVRNTRRVRNPIDALVQVRLEKRGLAPAPEAPPETLIRRLYLDLVGLPPPPEEVAAFTRDAGEVAYGRLVDRLLRSPHFGERWGRHWLDLARFAESDGYENDQIRPHAWRYRDWVIRALNDDLPFDRFTIEQLAGDLLPAPTAEQRVATGFHRNTLWNSAASADKEEFRTLAVKDRTDTTALAWMGLTVGCAKCHSHKYDPLSQREYYRLYAFFNATDHDEASVPGGQAHALKANRRTTNIHLRGVFLRPGDAVTPGTPAFLPPLQPRAAEADRLDLARWLVDLRHPLTARVAVNRVWMHLFGEGLVPTPENYGRSGAPPTHPELLDYLAGRFAARDGKGLAWSTRSLIRLIVTSTTYRQSSKQRPEFGAIDPENRLLGRQNRFRVEAEIVRDLSLAVSGLLDPALGGPSIVPPFPEGLLDHRFTNEALRLPTPARHRRGVYIHVQRTLTHPSLAAFDAADGNAPCVRRDRSITPIQALTLLNDPVFAECAAALGARLAAGPPGQQERLRHGFRLCLSREPTERELQLLERLVDTQRKLGAGEEAVWRGVGRTLLNLDEFTTRE